MFFPTPTRGKIFSQNAACHKSLDYPMSEENVPAVTAVSCRRVHASSGRRPNIALSSLIGLQPLAFWEKIWPLVEVGKNHCYLILHVILSLFMKKRPENKKAPTGYQFMPCLSHGHNEDTVFGLSYSENSLLLQAEIDEFSCVAF